MSLAWQCIQSFSCWLQYCTHSQSNLLLTSELWEKQTIVTETPWTAVNYLDMSRIYVQDTAKVRPRYLQNKSEIKVRYLEDLTKIQPRHTVSPINLSLPNNICWNSCILPLAFTSFLLVFRYELSYHTCVLYETTCESPKVSDHGCQHI